MAEENKILYRITVDAKTATGTISNMSGGFKRTQIAVEDLNEVLGEMNGEMSRTTGGIGRTMASLKRQRSNLQINSKEYQNVTKSMRFYQSQMDMSTGATGSASSAAMELGRVLSDAPYGIRGVANNISQFASQMAFAAKSTGSLRLAVKDLFKALTGPLGILLAIQGVIAVIEKMSMSKKKAKEDSENLNKALKNEIKTLEGYESVLNNANSSLEDRNGAIMAAIAGNKKYAKSILEGNDTLVGQESALKALLEEKKKQLELDNKLKELNPLNEKLKEETRSVESLKAKLEELKSSHIRVAASGKDGSDGAMRRYLEERLGLQELINDLERQKELLDEIQGLVEPPRQVVERSVEWYKQQISFAEKTREQLSTNSKAYRDQTKVIEGLIKKLEEITGKKGAKRKKVDYFDFKGLEEGRGKIIDEIMKTNEKIALLSAKDKKSRLIIQRDFHLRRLMAVDGANSELVQAYEKYYRKLIETAEEGEISLGEIVLKPPRTEGADKYEIAAVRLQKASENYIQVQSSLTSFMSGEFDRQLTIEQNKTNALNNELNQRLLNENLSKDERERIQLQIGQNDEKLRKKQEQIEKKRFRMNKAANIAGALVNTAAAAAGVMAEAKGGFFARLSQALPTIAFGLAQVATIARTKFQSSAGSGGSIGAAAGRSGGEGDSREFNFNLAGSTQSNQLTQSIASQLSQPIQTYVVSSEITTQQQLDLNIANTATIGG